MNKFWKVVAWSAAVLIVVFPYLRLWTEYGAGVTWSVLSIPVIVLLTLSSLVFAPLWVITERKKNELQSELFDERQQNFNTNEDHITEIEKLSLELEGVRAHYQLTIDDTKKQLSLAQGYQVLLLSLLAAASENAGYRREHSATSLSSVPGSVSLDDGMAVDQDLRDFLYIDLPKHGQIRVYVSPWMKERLGAMPEYSGARIHVLELDSLDALEKALPYLSIYIRKE